MHMYIPISERKTAFFSLYRYISQMSKLGSLWSAYVSIRQHTSAYVSILQHTSAYVSIRQHTSANEQARLSLVSLSSFSRSLCLCVCVCVCVVRQVKLTKVD